MKRLKLYDTYLNVVMDSKLKRETRRIAYKNKMTMSAYVRMMLKVANEGYKQQELLEKLNTGGNN